MKIAMMGVLALMVLCCRAQKPSGILNSYAFMRQQFAGTVAVDDKGRELPRGVDTVNLVYIETKNERPTIEKAWRNGRAYQVKFVAVKANPVELGNRQSDDRKLVLRPKAGNKLWQLQLEPLAEKKPQPPVKAYKRNDVILEGSFRNNRFLYTIRDIIMLAPIPAV